MIPVPVEAIVAMERALDSLTDLEHSIAEVRAAMAALPKAPA